MKQINKNKYITFEEVLSKKTLNIFWIIIDNNKNQLKFNKTRKKIKIDLEQEIDEIKNIIGTNNELLFMEDEAIIKLNDKLTNEEKSNIVWRLIEFLNKD